MGLFSRFFAGTRRDAVTAVAGANVVREGHALSQGLLSGGPGALRGNGHLVLAEHELVFVLALPRRTLRIPRDRILGVDLTRTHKGQWSGRKYVRVRFTADDGTEDAIAFEFPRGQADDWLAAIGAV